VAFDVLQRVNPSYALRLAGFVSASAQLGGFWAAATAVLLWQERGVPRSQLLGDWQETREHLGKFAMFWPSVLAYLRPAFHPLERQTDGLAADYLASVGES
jgi:hypothetical protein